ncbi:MAG: VOC family protein [Sphaerochaetaceae bacterium]
MDHVAFEIKDVQEIVDFFRYVFGFTVTKDIVGENGLHKIWMTGGLQFNENLDATADHGFFNHMAFCVKDPETVIDKAIEKGCHSLPAGRNWLMMPQNICLEVLPE